MQNIGAWTVLANCRQILDCGDASAGVSITSQKRNRCYSVFQSFTTPSPPAAAMVFPSGLNTACHALAPPGTGRVSNSAPDFNSHTLIWPSKLEDTRRLPSGWKLTPETDAV